MWWQQLDAKAQGILLNFQELMAECVRCTRPDKSYFAESRGEDFYFVTQIVFPLMNGLISFTKEPLEIEEKCQLLKKYAKEAACPMTWFWPHDRELTPEAAAVFERQGFQSMGAYTSVAAEAESIRKRPLTLQEGHSICLVETEEQFADFMKISREVYGAPEASMPALTRLYGAYQYSKQLKLYLGLVKGKAVSTLLGFQHGETLGLYNGATLQAYRKQGFLLSLIIHAAKAAPGAKWVVAQMMAAQNAKGVCAELGGKEYAHFTPLCLGYDLGTMEA